MTSPCKDCENRRPVCHSECDLYKEFKEECDRINDIRHRSKELLTYEVDATQRMHNKRGQGNNPALKGHRK